MTRFALTNGRVVLPHRVVDRGTVLIEDGLIVAILPHGELAGSWPVIDVGGRLITPGLVDIHIHGARGFAFNEHTVEAYSTIAEENGRRGVTSLLATTVTASIPDLETAINFLSSTFEVLPYLLNL